MQQGQPVATINAMKMQTPLQTERADMVRRVKAKVGDTVGAYDVLIDLV